MSVIIGSARNGENGTTGNQAGDQSGSEVSTQTFYVHSKGWYGFTPKDNDVAEKLAQAMQDACDNDYIGYDQGDRDTLLTQYKKYGSIKAIKTKCECDCSSLVRVCIYQATGVLLSDFDTYGEPSVLAASGLFKSKISVTSASQCTLAMVLVTKSKGHTAIVVSGAPLGGSSGSSSGTGTTSGTTSGTTVTATDSAKSGPDSSLSGTYKVSDCDLLNIRNGAGTSKSVMVVIPRGTSVQNYGYYTEKDGTKWLFVQFTYNGVTYKGFGSSKYLVKSSSSSSGATSGTTGTTGTTSSSKLTVDGEVGKKTTEKWQETMGQTGSNVDGFIDGQPSAQKKYWVSILTESCKWTGGASPFVKKMQQYVKDKGFDPGSIDGKLGKKTAMAWQKFLIAQGFSCGADGADGYFGTNSAKALQNWLNTK